MLHGSVPKSGGEQGGGYEGRKGRLEGRRKVFRNASPLGSLPLEGGLPAVPLAVFEDFLVLGKSDAPGAGKLASLA